MAIRGIISRMLGNMGFDMISMNGPIYQTTQNGVVARAGGGQPLATLVVSTIGRITTVATANDSVLLPKAEAGKMNAMFNTSANSVNVFPQVGDQINALGVNAAFALAAGKGAWFLCAIDGTWNTILSA